MHLKKKNAVCLVERVLRTVVILLMYLLTTIVTIIAASSAPNCLLGWVFFFFFLYCTFVLEFIFCVFLFIFSDCSMCSCEKQHSTLCIGIALQCMKFVLARQARRVDATNLSCCFFFFNFCLEETLFACFALETFFALLALATGQT